MSFLDRFKPQPRWKHTDPAIRAAAVAEIPDDAEHRGAIEELAHGRRGRPRAARGDCPRGRHGAPGPARANRSATPTFAARSRIDWSRSPPPPADSDADAALALEGLDDPKQFSTIAKSSPHDTVRAAALAASTSRRRSAASRGTPRIRRPRSTRWRESPIRPSS